MAGTASAVPGGGDGGGGGTGDGEGIGGLGTQPVVPLFASDVAHSGGSAYEYTCMSTTAPPKSRTPGAAELGHPTVSPPICNMAGAMGIAGGKGGLGGRFIGGGCDHTDTPSTSTTSQDVATASSVKSRSIPCKKAHERA